MLLDAIVVNKITILIHFKVRNIFVFLMRDHTPDFAVDALHNWVEKGKWLMCLNTANVWQVSNRVLVNIVTMHVR